jgi:hypothetical protein
MRPRDLPPDRSLFDCQDPPGDPGARARSPAELLDNLRLRLRQLPDGHPSAVRDRDAGRDAQPAPEPPAERIKKPAQADDYGEPDDPRAGGPVAGGPVADGSVADSEAGDTAAGDGTDAPAPGEGSLADLIRSIKDAGDALSAPADAGLLGEMDVFAGSGNGDPYRPWFMSGEPGTPWFAAGEEP